LTNMARFILETAGEDITVGGSDVDVIGTNGGGEEITVTGGNISLDASFANGGDTIALEGEAEDYTATVSGSRVILTSTVNGTTVSIPVGTAGLAIEFGGDDTRTLRVNGGAIVLADQVISLTGETEIEAGTDEVTNLTAALENLQDAQGALATFLAANDLDGNPATPTTEADIINARNDAQNDLNADLVEGTDEQLAAEVASEEADVNAAEADVAAIDDLPEAVAELEDAQEEYQQDIAAAEQAFAALAGEEAAYNTLQDPDVNVIPTTAEELADLAANDVVVESGGAAVIVVNAAGTALIAGPGAPAPSAAWSALLADAQAAFAAARAMDASEEAFADAIDEVVVLEGGAPGGAYYDEATGDLTPAFDAAAPNTANLFEEREQLAAAEAEVEERAELRTDLATAEDRVEVLEELNSDIDDAEEAIEEFGYEVPVTVEDGDSVTGTNADDIFVLDMGATGIGSATIDEFGDDSNDLLFFGAGFTAVELASTVDLEGTNQGNIGTLEVFIQQQGDDTVLYFEDEAFAGNASNGSFQGFVVVLEDVDATDVSFDATGYISIGDTTFA
jgi:flagellar biosynthesis GTPase FlhF